MSQIKRVAAFIAYDDCGGTYLEYDPHPDGGWVDADEAIAALDALTAERDALAKERNSLRFALTNIIAIDARPYDIVLGIARRALTPSTEPSNG